MFFIDIAGLRILYTGDYSREEDRHLVKAEIPPIRPDVLIVESTYGVQSLEGRPEKELRFTNSVHSIIRRGGHVLLPAFALGRAQELLLILDEYWKKHPDLHNVPVYYASGLARKSMAVYQTYIHTMNSNIRGRFAKRDNPFVFKYASYIFPRTVLRLFFQTHIELASTTWMGKENLRGTSLRRPRQSRIHGLGSKSRVAGALGSRFSKWTHRDRILCGRDYGQGE